MNGHQLRQEIFDDSAERLADIAYRAIHELGKDPSEIVTVAIHVDDPEWTFVADALMPGYDWQQFRDRGEKPVARGTVMGDGMCAMLSELVPSLADAIAKGPPDGHLFAFVLDGGGASVYAVPYNAQVVG